MLTVIFVYILTFLLLFQTAPPPKFQWAYEETDEGIFKLLNYTNVFI